MLHVSKDLCNISTKILKIEDLLATLEANAVNLNKHISNVFDALSDNNLCEDFRLYLKIHEIIYNKGNELEMEKMLTDLETKYLKLFRLKK